jgi:hypothetical protein
VETEVDGENPEEAAQQARAIQQAPNMSQTVFDVWAYRRGKMFRVDLVEQADKLSRGELLDSGDVCARSSAIPILRAASENWRQYFLSSLIKKA